MDRRLRAEIRRHAEAAAAEAASWEPYGRAQAVEFFRSLPIGNVDRMP
ncbi:hypothetical protein [Streptomyces sp. ISL-94]|nr:hypothetical protein [Streptomyces sp. ISL-94]MBT2481825.1 hypothetical protein [Streptomyces sp. ISL-94]